MKVNEAPEKLYLISDEDVVKLSYDPSTKLQYGNRYDFVDKEVFPIEKGSEVEYTRTDAFIEKARKWFELQNEGVDSDGNYKCDMTDFEDFKKYMEEEEKTL